MSLVLFASNNRATAADLPDLEPVGCWSSTIYVMVPDGSSIFEEHATVLRPASASSGPRVPLNTLHELA